MKDIDRAVEIDPAQFKNLIAPPVLIVFGAPALKYLVEDKIVIKKPLAFKIVILGEIDGKPDEFIIGRGFLDPDGLLIGIQEPGFLQQVIPGEKEKNPLRFIAPG